MALKDSTDTRHQGKESQDEMAPDEVAVLSFLLDRPRTFEASAIVGRAMEGSLFNALGCGILESASLTPAQRRSIAGRAYDALGMLFAGLEDIGTLMNTHDTQTGVGDKTMFGIGWLVKELAKAACELHAIEGNAAQAQLLHASRNAQKARS